VEVAPDASPYVESGRRRMLNGGRPQFFSGSNSTANLRYPGATGTIPKHHEQSYQKKEGTRISKKGRPLDSEPLNLGEGGGEDTKQEPITGVTN